MEKIQELLNNIQIHESVKKMKSHSDLPHKFIIAKNEGKLIYIAQKYSINNLGGEDLEHRDIAAKHEFDDKQILGGGYVIIPGYAKGSFFLQSYVEEFKEERPCFPIFCAYSSTYGSVPNEIMESFKEELLKCDSYNWSKNKRKIHINMQSVSLDDF